jgi:hypothetical protein
LASRTGGAECATEAKRATPPSPCDSRRVRLASSAAIALVLACAVAHASEEEPGVEIVTRTTPGAKGRVTVSLTLLPRAGHRIHADAPIVLRPHARGAHLERALYTRGDAVDPRAEAPRFELVLSSVSAEAELDVACAFTICRGARCRPVETSVRAGDLTGTRPPAR